MMELLHQELLSVEEVGKHRQGSPVLKGISFGLQRLRKIAVAGETGSGKSTLLRIIAGLVQPDQGRVLFQGKRVAGPDEKLIPGHPGIAYLSQHFELRNNYRIEEVLDYANQLSGAEAARIFEVCRISHLMKRRTDEVSGGEKQRIALARLLVMSPQLLLLDEPYSNLDPIHKSVLRSVIRDAGEKLGLTCMLISHDPLDTLSWADEILVLRDGVTVQRGSPEQIYHHPGDAYVAGLFGPFNIFTQTELSRFPGVQTTSQKDPLFVRPEGLMLHPEPETGIRGVVREIFFLGSYQDVEVEVPGIARMITARSFGGGWRRGQEVSISVRVPVSTQ